MALANEQIETQNIRLTAFNPEIKVCWMTLTRRGLFFDGVLQNATIHLTAEGHIFGSDSFPDGTFIQTSKVVNAGHAIGIGRYIETRSGSRYLVSTVNTTHILTSCAGERKQEHLKDNDDYFRPLMWSVYGQRNIT